jgi:hypothetical protein
MSMVTLRTIAALLAALGPLALSKELAVNMELRAEKYANGLVHEHIMETKHVSELQWPNESLCRLYGFAVANRGTEGMGRDG